jgi:hypothetical protein
MMAGEYPFREALHFIVTTVTLPVSMGLLRDDPYCGLVCLSTPSIDEEGRFTLAPSM